MKPYIIAEIGSCHLGDPAIAFALIEECKKAGADAVKFQLFPNIPKFTDSGNVHCSADLYFAAASYAKEVGIECSASVFDIMSLNFLLSTNPPWVKFAYSMKDEAGNLAVASDVKQDIIISSDVMGARDPRGDGIKYLFCIPRYPVYEKLSFAGIFPRFDGFSDHTLGIFQSINAVKAGAKIIEKHVRLPRQQYECPDARFAISTDELKEMCDTIRIIAGD